MYTTLSVVAKSFPCQPSWRLCWTYMFCCSQEGRGQYYRHVNILAEFPMAAVSHGKQVIAE